MVVVGVVVVGVVVVWMGEGGDGVGEEVDPTLSPKSSCCSMDPNWLGRVVMIFWVDCGGGIGRGNWEKKP